MCCCGKPVINGQPGYKWQENDDGSVRAAFPPALDEGDTLLFDEPGRCGGIDHHSHHFRLVKQYSSCYLLVQHGGGRERILLFPHHDLPAMFGSMDTTTRYWMLATIYDAHYRGERAAREKSDAMWREAAAEKRIRVRKVRGQNSVRVSIEPRTA
jgi:hypothetical protein